MDKTGIVQVESEEFSVISHTDNAIRYRVECGNDENMPHCTCSSWKKSYYLCKHFFAVFLKFPNWSWDALSTLYVNSPFLQLDIQKKNNVLLLKIYPINHPILKILKKNGNHSDEALQNEEKQEGRKEERGNNLVDLLPTKSWNLSLPSHCRSLQHEINHETINELYETLLNIRKKLQSVARK